MKNLALLAVVLFAGCMAPAYARHHRNADAVREFRATHPCPSTGRTTGHCTGWVVDHRRALCVGGADEPWNMSWQTFDKSHAKDRWECKRGWQQKLAECEALGCYEP